MLRVDADRSPPVSPEDVPWQPAPGVVGTPFDVTAPRPVGDGIAFSDPQVEAAEGDDHCFVLRVPDGGRGGTPGTAAVPHDPDGGRTTEVRTTEPGIRLYSAGQLDGPLAGPDCRVYGRRSAVCPRTQHLPGSPHRPERPSAVPRPGTVGRRRTEFRFPHLAGPAAAQDRP